MRSRRRLLTMILAACLPLAVAHASSDTEVDDANRKGILLWGNGTEVQDIDCQTVTGIPELHVLNALGEGLLMEDPVDLHPVPGVAERWEQSADGLTYTFHLRENALWSNGDPITADDFIGTYQRMLNPAIASEYANMLYDFVENAEDYYRGRITDFSKVGFKAVDPHTLQVRLKYPTPYLTKIIASHYSWYPLPVKVLAKFGALDRKGTKWTRPGNFVGNGAFVLKEWKPHQVMIVEKSPTYWDRDKVRLNEIHFFTVEDSSAEERMFRAGQLHVTEGMPPSKIAVYQREHPDMLRLEPYLGVYFYRCNVTRPPLNDVRVRRALALAIDRDTIVNRITRGHQSPAYNFTPPGFPTYHPKARLTGDLDEARRLLAEAGYPDGKGMQPIEVLFNTLDTHRAIAEALQQMWLVNLGVEVVLKNQEWKVYLDSQHNMNFSLERSGWIADYLDPHTFLEIFVTAGGNNDTGWSNAEYDGLREKALQARDDAERFGYYERMEQILVDELPVIPIYHYTQSHLVHPSLKGYYSNALDNHPYKAMWLDPNAGK